MDNSFDYPLVFTGDVINISETSATFTGKVTNLGSFTILESGFVWSLYHNNNDGLKVRNTETVDGVYSLNTNQELLPGKTYYVRAYVQTDHSTTYGRELIFKTLGKEASPGSWSLIFDYPVSTSWSEGCEPIVANFTINDSTYVIFNEYGLYCYSHINNTFKYLSPTPFAYVPVRFSVTYNGSAYIFSNNVFYRFDPKSLSFTPLTDMGQNQIGSVASGFIINDNIYVGIGPDNEYWKYNITTDSWHQLASYPGEPLYDTYSFSVDNTGYIASRTTSGLWAYDTENDSWTQKVNTPFAGAFSLDFTSTTSYGYGYGKNFLYKYYPIFDVWEELAHINTSDYICYPKIFAIGDKIYLLNIWNSDQTDHFNVWLYEK